MRRRLSLLITIPLFVSSGPIGAQTLAPDFLNSAESLASTQRLSVHPLSSAAGTGLSLNAELPLEEGVRSYVNSLLQGNSLPLEIKLQGPTGFGLASEEQVSLGFSFQGIAICDMAVRATLMPGRTPLILGSLPIIKQTAPTTLWPTAAAAWAWVEGHGGADGERVDEEACYFVENQALIQAWHLEWRHDGVGFDAIATSERSYRQTRRAFSIDAKVKIYDFNSSDGALKDITIPDMAGTGFLENKDFITIVDGSAYSRAYAADNKYTFAPETSEFAQTSAFTNAVRHLAWFRSIGYTAFGKQPLNVQVHATVGGTVNNAVYLPTNGTTNSTIAIGNGDGRVLKNLATDRDVVSHELGHHVIYGSVTSTQGESLVLHEGLADYFTFADTGNACLGESICPKGSPIRCAIDTACLRNGENSLAVGQASFPPEPHLRGQMVSGMLWKIRKESDIASNFDRVVLQAVAALPTDAKYEDLVLSLAANAAKLFPGKYCDAITKGATERGLGASAAKINCKTDVTAPNNPQQAVTSNGANGGSTASGSSSSSSTSGAKKGMCGVVFASAQAQNWLLLGLLLIPLVAALPKPQRQPAQSRAKADKKR